MKSDHTEPSTAPSVHGFSPGFAALGLEGSLLATLDTLGYEEPTPIQRESIPPDRKSTRLNSSHSQQSRMPSSA